MKPAAVLAALVALALPASASATPPALSLAQGRWFIERAVGPWDEHYRITDCQRTSTSSSRAA